ncbi:MAG: SusD/RagB family nutrient-binding outer membrane lipoprotein [Bacteroidetes bacterium]|nr:SusD/RagB family nutrient-binding outer membrane lipoprotein [Bacteroidota bacterium]
MKKHIFNKSLIALAVIMMLSSCKDLFNKDDIQKNPNSPLQSQIDVSQLTTAAMLGMSLLYEDTDNRIASIWGGHLAGTSRQHLTFQNYIVSSTSFGWFNYYNSATNARYAQAAAVSKAQKGVNQVIEGLIFHKMASLWGSVPYTEAMDLVNHPTPKYDDQAAVYASLITLLDDAVTNLQAGGGIADGDFIFNKDPNKWIAAARTLQARMYLHTKQYAKAVTAAQAGISSPLNDMLVPHGTSQQVDLNLNYDFFVNSRPGDTAFDPSLGSYLPAFMCTDISVGTVGTLGVAKRNAKTEETGLFNAFFGYENVQSGDGTWDPNVTNGVFQANSFSPILTFYENQLILAEAAQRLANTPTAVDPTALAALNSVRTTLETTGRIFGAKYALGTLTYTPYVAADFSAAGVANPATGPYAGMNEQTAFLREVASQKFIVLLMQFEVFTELRRLAVLNPAISLGVPINKPPVYPARYIYPQNEINTNPNTPKPAPDQFTKLDLFK